MKYIFLSAIFFILTFIFVSVPVYATPTLTRVRGNVYNQNNGGQGIGGLTVTVNCNGVVKTKVTDSFGLYIIDFTLAQCPKFTPVTATVTFNGETQNQTVYVSSDNTATLDFYFGALGVPEFGSLTAIFTALGSGGAFLGIRRAFLRNID